MRMESFIHRQQAVLSGELPLITFERRENPISPVPKPLGPSEDGGGPRRPDPESSQKEKLLKRMRKVDPKQAERYRQRTGE